MLPKNWMNGVTVISLFMEASASKAADGVVLNLALGEEREETRPVKPVPVSCSGGFARTLRVAYSLL